MCTAQCPYSRINKAGNILVNLTLRRVRETILAVEKQYYKFPMSVCSLIRPACKAHAPYYIVNCGLSDSTICFLIVL